MGIVVISGYLMLQHELAFSPNSERAGLKLEGFAPGGAVQRWRWADGFVVWDVGTEQAFEKFAVVRDFQMKELVNDHVFAEGGRLAEQFHAE